MTYTQEKLGRFGFHPDPATDFCCEVDYIEGLEYDVKVGAADKSDLKSRIGRAIMFRVGGDLWAILAKAFLREIESRAA